MPREITVMLREIHPFARRRMDARARRGGRGGRPCDGGLAAEGALDPWLISTVLELTETQPRAPHAAGHGGRCRRRTGADAPSPPRCPSAASSLSFAAFILPRFRSRFALPFDLLPLFPLLTSPPFPNCTCLSFPLLPLSCTHSSFITFSLPPLHIPSLSLSFFQLHFPPLSHTCTSLFSSPPPPSLPLTCTSLPPHLPLLLSPPLPCPFPPASLSPETHPRSLNSPQPTLSSPPSPCYAPAAAASVIPQRKPRNRQVDPGQSQRDASLRFLNGAPPPTPAGARGPLWRGASSARTRR